MNDTQKALQSWYTPDHPLYKELEPALLGLAGEVGELMEIYKKDTYKPGYSWWDCAACNNSLGVYHTLSDCQNYAPIVFDELGDCTWYLRIYAWLHDHKLVTIAVKTKSREGVLGLIKDLFHIADKLLQRPYTLYYLNIYYTLLLRIIEEVGSTWEEVIDLNYRKLNDDPEQNGWRDEY